MVFYWGGGVNEFGWGGEGAAIALCQPLQQLQRWQEIVGHYVGAGEPFGSCLAPLPLGPAFLGQSRSMSTPVQAAR